MNDRIIIVLAVIAAVWAALVGWFLYEVWRAPLVDNQGRRINDKVDDAELQAWLAAGGHHFPECAPGTCVGCDHAAEQERTLNRLKGSKR